MTVSWGAVSRNNHVSNIGQCVPDYMAQHPRRQPSWYSTPWEPDISMSFSFNDNRHPLKYCTMYSRTPDAFHSYELARYQSL